jgi:hypothetical protein
VNTFQLSPAPEASLGVWYRVEGSTEPYVRELRVRKVTECGVWLDDYGWRMGEGDRFVLRDARKRYACPTKEEAWVSFIARKRRHLRILQAQAKAVEYALSRALELTVGEAQPTPEPEPWF